MKSRTTGIGKTLAGCLQLAVLVGCGSGSNSMPTISNLDQIAVANELKAVEDCAELLRDARKKSAELQIPVGVNLLSIAENPLFADRCQLVTMSDPFSKGWLVAKKGEKVAIGHDGDNPLEFVDVQPGDLLELKQEKGQVYRIEKVSANRLELAKAIRFSLKESPKEPNYEVHRKCRPIHGEDPVAFGKGWIIDMTPLGPKGSGLMNHEEKAVFFAPDGTLLASQPGSALLWMRHMSAPVESKMEAIIQINAVTGTVRVYPVNRDPNTGNGDPLFYANK